MPQKRSHHKAKIKEDSKPLTLEVRLYRARALISQIPFTMIEGEHTTQDHLSQLLKQIETTIAGLKKNQIL